MDELLRALATAQERLEAETASVLAQHDVQDVEDVLVQLSDTRFYLALAKEAAGRAKQEKENLATTEAAGLATA